MNAYYTNTNIQRRYERTDSDTIRRAYLANTRKKAVANFISSLAESVDAMGLRKVLTTIKIISAVLCAIGFFTVICLMESSSISAFSGIVCTLIIAAIECLCFVPLRSGEKHRQ